MFSFLFRKHKEQSSIVFDINAESVGAAIVLSKPDAEPRVIYMCREYFFHGAFAEKSARQVIDAMREAFARLEVFLAKNILSHPIFRAYAPVNAHYAFSAPWLESKIKTVTLEWPEPTLVTEKFIAALVEREGAAFKAELAARPGASKTSFIVIENKVTSIRLNGYEVAEPYGKRAKTADVSLCISAIPTEIRDAVAFPAAGKVRSRKNYFSSFSSAAAEVIKKSVDQKEFVVLDILGPLTEIMIVRHGLLSAGATIPVGDDMLINAVAKHFSLSHAEALSRIKMFSKGHMHDEAASAMKKIIVQERAVWRAAFESTMNAAAQMLSVPPAVFVIARADDAPFFVRTLRKESIVEFGVDRVPVRQTLVTEAFLKSEISVDQGVSGDLALLLLCAYFTSSAHRTMK